MDELDNNEMKYTQDCQVYYVRDDYIARKVSFSSPILSTFILPQVEHAKYVSCQLVITEQKLN